MGPKARGDQDPFFPEKGETALVSIAIRACFTCSVRTQCDEYREATGNRYGVWAGKHLQRGKN